MLRVVLARELESRRGGMLSLFYKKPSTRVLFTMSYINIVLNIIPTAVRIFYKQLKNVSCEFDRVNG